MVLWSPLFVKLMFVVVVLLLVVELNAVVIQPESVVVAVVLLAVSLVAVAELVELVESVELVSFEDFLELSFADQCFVEQFVESEKTALISCPLYFHIITCWRPAGV